MRLYEPRFWGGMIQWLEVDDFEIEDWALTAGVGLMLFYLMFVMTR